MIVFTPNTIIKSADINLNFASLNTGDTTWNSVSYQNNWVDYDNSVWYGIKYRKDAMGYIHFKGLMRSGTTTNGTVLFNLPAGYRPSHQVMMFVSTNNGSTDVMGRVDVLANGNVVAVTVYSAYVSFNGSGFKAE